MAELLNIDTLIERPRVKIDGVIHEILSPDELPLLTAQRVAALGRKLDVLLKSNELNDTGKADLGKTLHAIAAIVMEPVPPEVRGRLSETHLMSVIEVFTMLSLGRKAKLAGAMLAGTAKTPSSGEKPSPDSSGSTAVTPPVG